MPSPKEITPLYNAPYLNKGRSKFNLSHTSHFDFYNGLLTPIDTPILVIPGDTFDVSQRTFIRMTQPLKVAPFDTIRADIHYFFVPMRLVWENWNKFITGDVGTSWNTVSSLTVPALTMKMRVNESNSDTAYNQVHSLADYIGIPPHAEPYNGSSTNNVSFGVSALPFRAYYLIWNWFYRYEPLFGEAYVDLSNSNATVNSSTTFISGPVSNQLCPVMKLPDYFTRALPQPTRGPEVALDLALPQSLYLTAPSVKGLQTTSLTGNMFFEPSTLVATGRYESMIANGSTDDPFVGFTQLLGGSVNGIREAFLIDKIRRIDALYGSRIDDYTKGHYGVTPPTIAFKPEYLGGESFDINVNQVVQTSDTGSGSGELGEIGGYSFTKHEAHYFTKSFTEFGYIFGLINTRVKHHTYAQGLSSLFRKRNRFDYWLPEMSNMSDQAIYKEEIYCDTTYMNVNIPQTVFGYQERGAEYKYLASRVAGYMRPQVNNTLDVWTYTDNYSSVPSLSTAWITEPESAIDRSLYLGYTSAPPFMAHIFFDIKAYRVMPYHSLPGELTHSW